MMPPKERSSVSSTRRDGGTALSGAEYATLCAAIAANFETEEQRLARLESILADYPAITDEERAEISHLLEQRGEAVA